MDQDNNARRIKKRLLIKTAKMAMDGSIYKEIDKLPIKLFPRTGQSVRCCIHKDRAVTRYRLQAILGYAIEDETDELKPLAEYAEGAFQREKVEAPQLTVIGDACTSCLKGRHFITNVCKGCVARPCLVNCPKNAIKIIDGKANIDEEPCVDCGKCLGSCAYHAIVYIPVPCEEACPVKAITKDDKGYEEIDFDKCINCGKCASACPFGAVTERSQIIDVIKVLKSEKQTAALLAPALVGQFPYQFEKIISATKKLGFDKVYEVASGAHITAKEEAIEFEERMEEKKDFLTTSCCPAYMELVEKHIPELKEYVSTTPTPMHFTGKMAKERNNNITTVFVSPCPAKRTEALKDTTVDYVISAEEYGALLVAAEIEIDECTPIKSDAPSEEHGRRFPLTGGVAGAVKAMSKENTKINPVIVNGIDRKATALLRAYTKGRCPGNLVEVMCCSGGCVGGPSTLEKNNKAKMRVEEYCTTNQKEPVLST